MKLLRVLFLLSLSVISYAEDTESYIGVTQPSADIELSFVQNSLIEKVEVKEGWLVKKGELLAIQNFKIKELEVSRLKSEVLNNTLIKRGETELRFKSQTLSALERAKSLGAISQRDIQDAKLAVALAENDLEEAKAQVLTKKMYIKELEEEIKSYTLKSPISGVVEKLNIAVGESPDRQETHIRLVRLKPLWVEAQVDRQKVQTLKKGAKSKIIFDNQQEALGKIIFISPLNDTASDTVRVRIAIESMERFLVGEQVQVEFVNE